MSTSPSWFDQEKFSRLVKKVGPKSGAAPSAAGARAVSARPPEKETRRLQRSLIGVDPLAEPVEEKAAPEDLAPVPAAPPTIPDAPIRATPQEPAPKESGDLSLSQFPPPMALPEPRSVSPLARRTTPLPSLKSIFEYEKPADRTASAPPLPEPVAPIRGPMPEIKDEPSSSGASETAQSQPNPPVAQPEFPGISDGPINLPVWPKFPAPEKVPAETDEEKSEGGPDEMAALRKEKDELSSRVEELSRAAGDRDDARAEIELLRTQLQQADEILQSTATSGNQLDELTRTIEERDAARRDYAKLREDFENLKKEQARARSGFLQEAGFAPIQPPDASNAGGGEELQRSKATVAGLETSLATMKRELEAMQKQVAQSRDETSVAQRGLALSQKALQETRDALREASDGTSQSKASVEKLKSECASLVQQNLALQSRLDQMERELNSVRGKVADRG